MSNLKNKGKIMNKILLASFLLITLVACGGQKSTVVKQTITKKPTKAYSPYTVKSGKIVYEYIRYSLKISFSYKQGRESGSRELIPHVAEQKIYYWDDFGAKAFEETWQVSKFGGEPLAQKVKISEQLWLGDKRYYYKDKKISIDPWHSRVSGKKPNYGTYTSTKMIIGKQTKLYRESAYTDFYIWNGLRLKQQNFSTSKGKRSDISTEFNAIEVNTVAVDSKRFKPSWL